MAITEYTLPGDGVHPEGITADPDGVTFYVSSAKQGTIFRGRVDRPEAQVWQPAGADGRTAALGMAVDGHGRLLVCGWQTGRLYGYDTASGALVWSHQLPDGAGLNDVCVLDGHAYVTDSGPPRLWRVPVDDPHAPGEPQLWADLSVHGASPEPYTDYLNGIVATPDGSALLVAAQGSEVLWRVDVADGTGSIVDLGGEPVSFDGMVFVGDTLYACDNTDTADGLRFWLTAVRLDTGATAGSLLGRWPRPTDDTPTTLAHLDGRLLLVNSQFLPGREGRAAAPFTVSAIPVPS